MNDVRKAFVTAFWFLAVAFFLLGGLVFWLAPKLWHRLAPIIHRVTA